MIRSEVLALNAAELLHSLDQEADIPAARGRIRRQRAHHRQPLRRLRNGHDGSAQQAQTQAQDVCKVATVDH